MEPPGATCRDAFENSKNTGGHWGGDARQTWDYYSPAIEVVESRELSAPSRLTSAYANGNEQKNNGLVDLGGRFLTVGAHLS